MSDTNADAWNARPSDAPSDAPAPANGEQQREASPPARDREERRRSASPGREGRGRADEQRGDPRDSRDQRDYRDGGRPQERYDAGQSNPGNNLHVSSLAFRVDERELETVFGKYGVIDKVQIMFDPHTRESRGFGFVTMKTSEEADAAIDGLNNTELGGKIMRVEKARRGRARTPTPGRYFGPPRDDFPPSRGPPPRGYAPYGDRGAPYGGGGERPYAPAPYDNRYDDRRGGDPYRRDERPRYADERPAPRGYDRPPPSRYDDRPVYDDRRGPSGGGRDPYGAPSAYPPRDDRDRRY